MSAWRVVETDSESRSGVAPVCPGQHDGTGQHETWPNGVGEDYFVYDCCPGPHIETASVPIAAAVAALLTEADAEVCS